MLTNEDRQHILKLFLENIARIGDKEYQKRVWIRGEGPEWDSFDETCCKFFDREEGLIENYKKFNITEEQLDMVKKFGEQLDSFSDYDYPPGEFINSPEWARIMEMAQEVLKAFSYRTKTSES